MSIKIEKTENANELKLSFEVEAAKFDEAIKKVYAKSAKYFNIPGVFNMRSSPCVVIARASAFKNPPAHSSPPEWDAHFFTLLFQL